MRALVNKESKLKMKLTEDKYSAPNIIGIGNCPKCNTDRGFYVPKKRNVLVCMGCWEDNDEVNGNVLLEGKAHYKYKEAPRI